jgi:hypothetical protein
VESRRLSTPTQKAEVRASVLEQAQERLDQRLDAMIVRRSTVEHPFASIKAWMGATHFRMKTLKHVATEMALHVLAYNLKRVMAILGVRELLESDVRRRSPVCGCGAPRAACARNQRIRILRSIRPICCSVLWRVMGHGVGNEYGLWHRLGGAERDVRGTLSRPQPSAVARTAPRARALCGLSSRIHRCGFTDGLWREPTKNGGGYAGTGWREMSANPAFTVEEIKTLQVALNAAMDEATKKGINIPLDAMLRALFASAEDGERDLEKLKAAMLAAGPPKDSAVG